jgi:hypothetical protein
MVDAWMDWKPMGYERECYMTIAEMRWYPDL